MYIVLLINVYVVIYYFVIVKKHPASQYLIESSQNGLLQWWGHPLVRRNNTAVGAKPRSWVDSEVILPSGRLKRFKIYHTAYTQPTPLRYFF